MRPVRVAAVTTAVPPHKVEQSLVESLAPQVFGAAFADFKRLLPVFAHTQVKTRYLSQPVDWYLSPHRFEEANQVYQRTALDLSLQASEAAIRQSGLAPDQIAVVVLVSTTGLATPSLDAKLIERLGLPRGTARVPIWGLGCAGGVAGLARSLELVQSLAGRYALFVAVELCSLTFQLHDLSKANLIGASLFGDGAAALVIGEEADGPELLGSYSHLFPDSEDIMGWDFTDSGLKLKLSRDLPSFTRAEAPRLLEASLGAWGVKLADIAHYAVHPGGAKVLQAIGDTLSLDESALEPSYYVLRNYGNMSSPSVLFAFRRLLETRPRQDALGLMLAFGPGFSAEQVLFRW
jgi:alkylresorcinol/alkylpyrone synthase